MMRPEALAAALAEPDAALPQLIWVASDEDLLRLESCDQVRQIARRRGCAERQVQTIERTFNLALALAQASAGSLFSSRTLLELQLAGKPTKTLGEALLKALPQAPKSVLILVSSLRFDWASSQADWLKKLAQSQWIVNLPTVERAQLPTWIGERLARSKQRADPDTLRWMAQKVEGNLLAADQEVRKLALLEPSGLLPLAAVQAAVLDVARWDVFTLIDAMLQADAARTMRCLNGLRAASTPAPVVLWALADTVRGLLKHGPRTGNGRRAPSPRERLYAQALRRLPHTRLYALLQACAHADQCVKGLGHTDPDIIIDQIALELAGAPVLHAHPATSAN